MGIRNDTFAFFILAQFRFGNHSKSCDVVQSFSVCTRTATRILILCSLQMRLSLAKLSSCRGSTACKRHRCTVVTHANAAHVLRSCVATVGIGAVSMALSMAANAASVSVKMGADDGGLVFVPATVAIQAGDKVTWVNNSGFPHNIEFDEEDVPEVMVHVCVNSNARRCVTRCVLCDGLRE
jgi:plastocyanin